MMLKLIKIIIIIISFLTMVGCVKDEITTTELKGKGLFIVDTLMYVVDEAIAPNDSLWNYVEYNLTYHFENYSGMLNVISFIINDTLQTVLNIDYAYPDPVNKFISRKDRIWLQRKLNDKDTLKVDCTLKGAFAERINNSNHFIDTFDWQTQQIIYYQR